MLIKLISDLESTLLIGHLIIEMRTSIGRIETGFDNEITSECCLVNEGLVGEFLYVMSLGAVCLFPR